MLLSNTSQLLMFCHDGFSAFHMCLYAKPFKSKLQTLGHSKMFCLNFLRKRYPLYEHNTVALDENSTMVLHHHKICSMYSNFPNCHKNVFVFVVFYTRSNQDLRFALVCYVFPLLIQNSFHYLFFLLMTLPLFQHPSQLAYRMSHILYLLVITPISGLILNILARILHR